MNPIEPDPHLQAALRHAPDAQLAAPAELSAQILAAAHRSAAEAPRRPVTAPTGWRLWAWWRQPQASAAMATVLLAGVVGLLWRDEQPGPASKLDLDPGPTAQAPLAEAPPPPPSPPEALKPEVSLRLRQAQDRHRERDEAPRKAEARESNAARARSTPAVATAVLPDAVLPNVDLPDAVVADRTRQASAEQPSTAPARAPSASSAAAVAAVAAAPPPAAATVAAEAAAPGLALMGTPSPAVAPGARTSAAQSPRPAATRLAASRPSPAFQVLEGWTWQPGTALRDPDRAWMTALFRQTQGLWQSVGHASPASASWRLELLASGEVKQQLWLEADSLLWCSAGQACQRAPLAPQQRQALLDELAR